MNARLKAEAERIKNAQLRAEREKQEQQRRAEQEKQEQQRRAEQEKQGQQRRAEQEKQEQQRRAEQPKADQGKQKEAPGQPNIQQKVPKQPLKEEKAVQAGTEASAGSKEKRTKLQMEAQESVSYRPVHAPRIQAVQGLLNRVQYSERILQDVAARLDWMERNPMGKMPYAPLMNSFQRSMAVPVFQAFVQYQDMAQYPYQGMPWQSNPQANRNPQMGYQDARTGTNMQMAYRGAQINYGNPMNPQMGQSVSAPRPQMWQAVQGQNPYMYSQAVQNQNPYMYSQAVQNQNPYMYSQAVQNQNSYMYSQPIQNQNPYMYSQPMQSQDPYMYSYPGMDRQQEQMQMAYMLQNMSLIRLALTYASISIMETYNQIKDWLSERGKQKSMSAEPDMQVVSNSKERGINGRGETKAASPLSEKRQISFKDLEKQECLAMGKEAPKKTPMTLERNPLTRQKEKGMTH